MDIKKNITLKSTNVLLVDDEKEQCEALIRALKRQGGDENYIYAQNDAEAFAIIEKYNPGAVVLDLNLDISIGPSSGLELISKILRKDNTIRIIVLTGHGSEEFGIEALQRGAASFLQKPADTLLLLVLIRDALNFSNLQRRYIELRSSDSYLTLSGLKSRSSAMAPAIEAAVFAASNSQAVLITGETGTGKGVFAQAIHKASKRARYSFVRAQPSFGSKDLSASELFGHVRGAFTGASEDRKGLIEEAHRGTLFIDEVAELTNSIQVMLLETLQEKTFRKIGGNKELQSDFRLISATNKQTKEILSKDLLRSDFYHRIAHIVINIPPLRERPEDILDLSELFLNSIANRDNLRVYGFTKEAKEKLLDYDYPGNVRQLQAAIEVAACIADFNKQSLISTKHINLSNEDNIHINNALSLKEKVALFQIQQVEQSLRIHNHNQSKAAEFLKIDRTQLRRILRKKTSQDE